ncbi:MAG TPA: hypothetical protein VN631_18235 [Negativicutes bacterium]|nr:hypothetical protein [Negativicutes bacterium]
MEAHTKFDIAHAFVATSSDISMLWGIFQKAGLTITATISCTDGLVRHFDNCDSLVKYENPTRAAITSLEISAKSRDPYTTAEISLGARYSAPISISLRGEEHAVSLMRTYVSDTVDGMRAWYSRLSTIDFFYVWFPIFMVLFLLAKIMSPSDIPHPAMPLKRAIEVLAIFAAGIAGIAAVIWAIAWLRKRFFPLATFAIGQGLSRHQHNEQVRWVVIIGFVVGVGASIFATILHA